nr:hypothetical protein [Paenibacillus sp. cl141a]
MFAMFILALLTYMKKK